MKTFDLKYFGKTYAIRLIADAYYHGGNLYVGTATFEDGYVEPCSDLTVNLGSILPLNCAYIDVNNNGSDILDWLQQNKIAVPTGRYRCSGICKYPEYLFDEHLLRESDPDGYSQYLIAQHVYQKPENKENDVKSHRAP